MNKRISVIGMGYIGLPTATTFSAAGYKVYGYDINNKVIETLKNGKIHFIEPDLQGLFKNVLDSGNLIPTNKIVKSDIYVICVPTPLRKDNKIKSVDLSFVEKASETVGKVLSKGNLVILESTVPPRTTDETMVKVLEETSGLKLNDDFLVAHCPERVLPGKILYELAHNDRIIGVSNEKAGVIARELYSSIVTDGKIYITDTITAEMCKLIENTYRDINIAFANELSIISDELGINVNELINLANKHPRVNILKPGPGVGGHCLAIDPWFIVEQFPETAKLIKTAREINDYKPHWVVKKVLKDIKRKFGDKKITIGILGLAYKANIDDLRESPSLKIASGLQKAGYKVIACEPNSKEKEIDGFKNLPLEETVNNSDYFVYTVNNNHFKDGGYESIKTKPYFDVLGEIK